MKVSECSPVCSPVDVLLALCPPLLKCLLPEENSQHDLWAAQQTFPNSSYFFYLMRSQVSASSCQTAAWLLEQVRLPLD